MYKAIKFSEQFDGKMGLCVGFDYSTWLFAKNYIDVKDFGENDLSSVSLDDELKNWKYNGKCITADQLIQYCYIYQSSPKYSWNNSFHYKKPCLNYDSIVDGIKKSIEKNKACIIRMNYEKMPGHVVLAYKYEESEKQCKFYVYDNNNETANASVEFFRENSKSHYYSGSSNTFKYLGQNYADTKKCTFSYIDVIDDLTKWLESGGIKKESTSTSGNYGYINSDDNNLIWIDNLENVNIHSNGTKVDNNDLFNSSSNNVIPISVDNGDSTSSDKDILAWSTSKTLSFNSINDSNIEIISDEYKIEIKLPLGATVDYEDKSEETNKPEYTITLDNPSNTDAEIIINDKNNKETVKIIKKNETSTIQGNENGIVSSKNEKNNSSENNTITFPKLGSKHTLSSGTYKVTSSTSKKKEVTFVKPKNKKVTSVSIPATVTIKGYKYKVTAINKNAFKGYKKLKKVKIGKNVKSIGNKAFYGCTKLSKVTIGANVTSIGASAFEKCTSLKSIAIPKKVTKIGKKAFYGCKKLKTINIKTTKLKAKTVGVKAFGNIYKKPTVKIQKKSNKAYKKWIYKKGLTKKAKIK